MRRSHIVTLMIMIVAVPAAAASSYFTTSARPCFITGSAGYELSGGASANFTVRIDNSAANPALRLQLVDDPAQADFVLVDDGVTADACKSAITVSSIRLDPAAAKPDITVTLAQADMATPPADYKIYVSSAHYAAQDAAALFAVIWQNARKTGLASRHYAEGR